VVGGALFAVTTVGWVVRGAIALVAMLAIYLVGAGTLRKFKIAPDAEPDPSRVVPVDARFACIVCGAEVTMTAAQGGDALEAPRHCREEMVRVGPVS
jgi:hypothetical protein